MNNRQLTPPVVLSTVGLSKTFPGVTAQDAPTPIVRNLNLTVLAGESVAIVGASGAGKSTLLHVLGGLDKADSGSVRWGQQAIEDLGVSELGHLRNKSLGFVYQFHHLLPEFSAVDNVAMALRIGGAAKKAAQAQAAEVLSRLGLSHRLTHRPAELSGGERQRVAIARALVTQPKAILADEPTGNLDAQTADQVFEALLDAKSASRTALVMVTHSMELASRCQRVLRLVKGELQDITQAQVA